jgi:hypothetical protein
VFAFCSSFDAPFDWCSADVIENGTLNVPVGFNGFARLTFTVSVAVVAARSCIGCETFVSDVFVLLWLGAFLPVSTGESQCFAVSPSILWSSLMLKLACAFGWQAQELDIDYFTLSLDPQTGKVSNTTR